MFQALGCLELLHAVLVAIFELGITGVQERLLTCATFCCQKGCKYGACGCAYTVNKINTGRSVSTTVSVIASERGPLIQHRARMCNNAGSAAAVVGQSATCQHVSSNSAATVVHNTHG